MPLPPYTEARIDSADLTEVQPAEYRADVVVLLLDGVPVKCPVYLLVITADEAVARWAAQPIELGKGSRWVPLVLRPSGVPAVTDPAQARADPELAVLSAMAHGKNADIEQSLQIAVAAHMASLGLDEDRSRLYFDLVLDSLSKAERKGMPPPSCP